MNNNPNQQIIKSLINQNISSPDYYVVPSQIIYSINTDINQWPYPRFFRGKASSYEPIIFEREAGYCPIDIIPSVLPVYAPVQASSNTCFQVPCSTVFPCSKNKNASVFLGSPNSCIYTSP